MEAARGVDDVFAVADVVVGVAAVASGLDVVGLEFAAAVVGVGVGAAGGSGVPVVFFAGGAAEGIIGGVFDGGHGADVGANGEGAFDGNTFREQFFHRREIYRCSYGSLPGIPREQLTIFPCLSIFPARWSLLGISNRFRIGHYKMIYFTLRFSILPLRCFGSIFNNFLPGS